MSETDHLNKIKANSMPTGSSKGLFNSWAEVSSRLEALASETVLLWDSKKQAGCGP